MFWLLMESIAIGGLHDDEIGLLHIHRVIDYWLIKISNISTEDQVPFLVTLLKPDLNGRRTEQMSRVGELDFDTCIDPESGIVRMAGEEIHSLVRICNCIQRLDLGLPCSPPFSILPLGLHLLDMSRICKHDRTEICSRLGTVYSPTKPIAYKEGNPSRMVYVSMGQKHIIDFGSLERKVHTDLLFIVSLW